MALKFPQLHVVENNKKSLGIYVHIPFCRSKCEYCDFYSLPGARDKDRMDEYTAALVAHIREAATGANGYEVDTVYFGGGTPSFFGAGGLARIFAEIDRRFDVSRDAEVTFEANPDSVTLPMLTHLRRAGFNRISIGVQSDLDEQLKALGRPHNYKQAQQAVSLARRAGFDNLSVDLMFGLPNQSREQWMETLRHVIDLKADHISCYGLKVEEGTKLWTYKDCANLPDDDAQADMYFYAVQTLEEFGYHQYEISNFAKDGFICRHNMDGRRISRIRPLRRVGLRGQAVHHPGRPAKIPRRREDEGRHPLRVRHDPAARARGRISDAAPAYRGRHRGGRIYEIVPSAVRAAAEGA